MLVADAAEPVELGTDAEPADEYSVVVQVAFGKARLPCCTTCNCMLRGSNAGVALSMAIPRE
ncbi:MAG: hypothetical protein U5K56_14560 [Halioglobus sp.]|nr:hypothetical protein [Halioglobus sp.]